MSYIKRESVDEKSVTTDNHTNLDLCDYTPAHPALLFKAAPKLQVPDHLNEYVEVDPFSVHAFESAEASKPVRDDMPGNNTFTADLCKGVFDSFSEAKIKKFIFWLFEDGPFSEAGLKTIAASKIDYGDHAAQAAAILESRKTKTDLPLTRGTRKFYRMQDGAYAFYLALKHYPAKVEGQLNHEADINAAVKKTLAAKALEGKTQWKAFLYILLHKMKAAGEKYKKIWDYFLSDRHGLADITDNNIPPNYTNSLKKLEAFRAYQLMGEAREAAIKAAQDANDQRLLEDAIALPGWGFELYADKEARTGAIKKRNDARGVNRRKKAEDERKAAARG